MIMKILHLEPENYSPQANDILQGLGDVIYGPFTRAELIKNVHDIDVLIVRLGHQIDIDILNKATKLKAIVSATTGLNHIDVQYAEKKDITVLSLKGERGFLDTIHATAEHTFALLLALIRHVPFAHNDVISGRWDRNYFKGSELEEKTLGIIGLGRLGRKVAGYAIAFGMRVVAYDSDVTVSMPDVTMLDLADLAAQSDVVSLHIPSSSKNYHFIDADFYRRVKPGIFVINTSRGDVHNQAALLEGLISGRIRGAALDVLEEEVSGNISASPIVTYARSHSKVILTPHIGGATAESMEKTEVFMARKLAAWLNKT